jgi:excisionase family DNA binding protein
MDAQFPVTHSDWWCGEFNARADQAGYALPVLANAPSKEANETRQQLLTTREAAKRLGICERSLYKLTQTGAINATRLGKRVLYSASAIEELVIKSTRRSE